MIAHDAAFGMAALRAAAGDWGLSPNGAAVLLALAQQDGRRSGDLATLCAVSAPSISALLDRLHERGSVERARDAGDARTVLVRLTEPGRALAAALAADWSRHAERLRGLWAADAAVPA